MAVHCAIAFTNTLPYLLQDNSSHRLLSWRVPGLASYAIMTTTSISFDQFTRLKTPLLVSAWAKPVSNVTDHHITPCRFRAGGRGGGHHCALHYTPSVFSLLATVPHLLMKRCFLTFRSSAQHLIYNLKKERNKQTTQNLKK